MGREPRIGLRFPSPSRPARGHTAVVSRYQAKIGPGPGTPHSDLGLGYFSAHVCGQSSGARPPRRPSNRRGAISFSKSWFELLFRARLQAEFGGLGFPDALEDTYSRFCKSWSVLPFRARLRAEFGAPRLPRLPPPRRPLMWRIRVFANPGLSCLFARVCGQSSGLPLAPTPLEEAYSRFCESWFGLPFRARLRAEFGGQSDFITQEVSRHCQGEFEGG